MTFHTRIEVLITANQHNVLRIATGIRTVSMDHSLVENHPAALNKIATFFFFFLLQDLKHIDLITNDTQKNIVLSITRQRR